jgi:hexosaminidase
MSTLEAQFRLDESSLIVIPEGPSEQDLFLARFLTAEVSDRYGLGLSVKQSSSVPSTDSTILIGSVANPLVRDWCAQHGLGLSAESPGPEGYVLRVDDQSVVVAGSDERGAFYGLQSLRQMIKEEDGAVRVPGVLIRDWPHKVFRGMRLFLPGSGNLAFFRRFVRDFVALLKFNKLIVEVNGCMRLDRHPELNAGQIEFARDLAYSRSSEPINHRGEPQNSAHQDAADGGIVEKDQVAEIVRYASQHHIEVIPEIPSLTHSFYLLARHHELAEIQDIKWPDTYCPLNPESYELLFDVLDEYIEVMQPKMVHIGHDEWRMAVDVCERCRGQEYTELFARDVIRIHRYLRERGIRVAMWGDHLMESVRNKGWRDRTSYAGRAYRVPGALSETQVRELIPKDILVFNWFWADSEGWLVPRGYRGEDNDVKLAEMGFQQVYGNMGSHIENWGRRSARDSVLGGAPSSWIATTWARIWSQSSCAAQTCCGLRTGRRRSGSGKSSET